MKQIKNYINERLHVTTKSHLYSCQPKTKEELQEIIIKRIENKGNECDLNDIDVSKIDDMSCLFDADTECDGNDIFNNFNGEISLWNVSNVEDMNNMFNGCLNFNCDISDLDVSNVTNMNGMFKDCVKFNGDKLYKWNVSNVMSMDNAFWNCPKIPKWYDKDKWDY